MDGYFPLKMKRKVLEDVNDDFTDFYLSFPARKSRRLNAELPPIIEEEECELSVPVDHSPPQEQRFGGYTSRGVKIEELPSAPESEERAIVRYKPIKRNTPYQLLQSSVSVSPSLISGFKNQVMRLKRPNQWKLPHDDAATEDHKPESANGCLAVVPWVPSQLPSAHEAEVLSQIDGYEMMDAEEVEQATMDVEDVPTVMQSNVNESGGTAISDCLHQWEHQHCMIPQPPHNTTTPIFWFGN